MWYAGAENLVLPDDKRDSRTALGLGRVSIIRFRKCPVVDAAGSRTARWNTHACR